MNKPENEVLNENPEENQPLNQEGQEEQLQTEPEKKAEEAGLEGVKLKEMEAKAAEWNDKYIRLYSEFDNFRKRTTRERAELIKTAGEEVFKAFLSVIDDFERAIKANEHTSDVKAVNEGVHLIYNKMKGILAQKGLETMESKGKPFDADLMEAITHIPAPEEELKGKVVDEVEKGYLLNGKVIRYAKVVVGS